MSEQLDPPRRQVLAMAVTTGATIANVYYCQPILSQIRDALALTDEQAGILPFLTQIGVGFGLFFLAPLGDMIDRKKLVICLEILLSLALAGMSMADDLVEVAVASLAVGVFAVAVQIVVPMAASIATAKTKGRIIGAVFTGTLCGILASRIISGYVTDMLGWRWVYAGSAAVSLRISVLVHRTFPRQLGQHSGTYFSLMISTVRQFGRFAKLRRISLLGAFVFGAFCSFWTTLTFHLSTTPFSYSSGQIGLFGLVAIGGTLVAPIVGRIADHSSPERTQVITVSIMIFGILCAQHWTDSVLAFIVATFLLDVGVQATQVNNLAQIYRLDEAAHSRINTVFMVIFFLGGAIGSYCGVWAWSAGGYTLVSYQLLLFGVIALAIAIFNLRAQRRI
ncbi:Predicted arabinose efflux permease, MFS family [Rhizobium sp. NFR07]|uniref:MFS transporter n=1 Tax=Rhizobium sp. NFR07 TaxID=1566262 RepID=UPI0008EDEB68|nr:MFS transporter [Rhizobium sp. NFR07]SFB65153.1 Predicted arabinose efflux permease, MFS family [Rhizobium sp. NFR07]